VDWDSPPIYDSDIIDSLFYDHGEDSIVQWDIYPEENELVEEVEPVDSMAYFDVVSIPHELHEDLLGKMPYFNDEDDGYVDFLRVDNILFNSHNNDEFYVVGKHFMFTREASIDPFKSITWRVEGQRYEESLVTLTCCKIVCGAFKTIIKIF
jgi:hypothetical protein